MKLQGVLPIIHSPFDVNDNLVFDDLVRQLEWAIDTGADGYGTGMVSELVRLTYHERLKLHESIGEITAGRVPFFAGVGAESTKQAVEFARHAEQHGAHVVMATPPLITGLPDSEVLRYYETLLSEVAIPVIVQDASSYVGKAIPHHIGCELLERFGAERVLFKPEAAPLGPNLSALRDALAQPAAIFEGSGGIGLVDSYRRGITGTMPGMEFLPGIVALWRALRGGANDDELYRIQFPICALVALQLQAGLDGFLAVEKYVLHKRGLFSTSERRRPYSWDLDEETRLELDRLLLQLDKVCV